MGIAMCETDYIELAEEVRVGNLTLVNPKPV
ncbi:hypothetical protein LP7551_04286 [Roseibium album]|nr:hypothetical protein LP7551_04286 [Roseibium album]